MTTDLADRSSSDGEDWDLRLSTIGIDALADQRAEGMQTFRNLLEHLRRRAARNDAARAAYLHAAEAVSVDELTHLDLATIGRTLNADIVAADSFWRSIAVRRRRKQIGPVPERFLGISKEFDQLFASTLKTRAPRTLYEGPLADVPSNQRTDTFLKPQKSSGSKRAFYLWSPERIQSVQHMTELTSWDDMVNAVRQEFGDEFVDDGVWQVQEVIREQRGAPARDLKFYAFYGEIGLIQEVSRHRGARYEYFNEDGSVAPCGRSHEPRFENAADTITDKGGVDETRLEQVRSLSSAIPAPFMRIDFLNGADGLVFAEFSSAPGMSNTLSDSYDRCLGRMYLEAENRLTNDLLDGKRFEKFHSFLRARTELVARQRRQAPR